VVLVFANVVASEPNSYDTDGNQVCRTRISQCHWSNTK